MANSRIITALDVGTTKVCAIIAEIDESRRVAVRGVGASAARGITKGIVTDLRAAASSIKSAMTSAEDAAGIGCGLVYMAIAGEHIACVNARKVMAINRPGSQVSKADVNRLIDMTDAIVLPPDREIMHMIPRFYAVDGQAGISNPVGMHAVRLELEAHVITGLSTFIHNMVKCADMVGVMVHEVIFGPLAEADAVLCPHEKEIGTALIDIGGGTTDVLVMSENRVSYSASIPIGGNHVTRDISIGLRTEIDEAEKTKIEHGCIYVGDSEKPQIFRVQTAESGEVRILPLKVLAEIIEPRMSEICELVLNKLTISGCMSSISSGVVLTGGGSQIPGLEKLASEIIGVPARIGVPIGIANLDGRMIRPEYSTAIGLVMYAAKHCEMQFSAEGFANRLEVVVGNAINQITEYLRNLWRTTLNFR